MHRSQRSAADRRRAHAPSAPAAPTAPRRGRLQRAVLRRGPPRAHAPPASGAASHTPSRSGRRQLPPSFGGGGVPPAVNGTRRVGPGSPTNQTRPSPAPRGQPGHRHITAIPTCSLDRGPPTEYTRVALAVCSQGPPERSCCPPQSAPQVPQC
ncbi:sterile alpha motif domain-containing protein 1-like [Schistocerca cancellata]|uniref:sterile alpha motif domain-containing protein 1-like n=1 Tax=Schistocerca cancellata TaxID=274614 RepID=UPI0021176BA4|nr:sterile alpha motif domain-containing protein 1-like [Schistocerca cancellata]